MRGINRIRRGHRIEEKKRREEKRGEEERIEEERRREERGEEERRGPFYSAVKVTGKKKKRVGEMR